MHSKKIHFQVNDNFNRILIQIKDSILPIYSLIIEWKPPYLNCVVNCKLVESLKIEDFSYINGLSLPFSDHQLLVANEAETSLFDLVSIENMLRQNGCIVYAEPKIQLSTETLFTANSIYINVSSFKNTSLNQLKLDSDFLLLTYNARILQYRNFLELQKLKNNLSLLQSLLESLIKITV